MPCGTMNTDAHVTKFYFPEATTNVARDKSEKMPELNKVRFYWFNPRSEKLCILFVFTIVRILAPN